MISEFVNFLEKKVKISIANKILLAISGGADSVTMLHLFSITGYNCGIAHCNFHLRGSDSVLDEELVQKLAKKYSFPFYKTDFDTKEYAAENGISIEMAARELRYKWFEKIREENDYQYIATAHHQDDLIETFFINLTRGTGIRGLCGFRYKHEKIIRPMLFTDRQTIMKYLRNEKLEYREDRTNSDLEIIRNRFRHKILPHLLEMNPAYKQNILQSIDNLHDAELLMNNEIEKAKSDLLEYKDKEVYLNINRLLDYKRIHPYLFELLQPFGFNGSQINGIESVLKSESGKVYFSKSHRLLKDRNMLIISPIDEGHLTSINLYEDDKQIVLQNGRQLFINAIYNSAEFKIPKVQEVASVDFDKLKFPMEIRKWEPGDYFYPFGMKQKKKISDFLIDQKISLFEKQRTLVLLSEGEIVWVIGKRIDERFKITQDTDKILNMKLEVN